MNYFWNIYNSKIVPVTAVIIFSALIGVFELILLAIMAGFCHLLIIWKFHFGMVEIIYYLCLIVVPGYTTYANIKSMYKRDSTKEYRTATATALVIVAVALIYWGGHRTI